MTLSLLALAYGLGLVIAGVFYDQAIGESSPTDLSESCSEPDNLMQLYRDLREQQILDASLLHEPGPAGDVQPSSIGTSTTTRFGGHQYSGQWPGLSGVCHCQTRDELNHNPTRIPKMRAQSSCRRSRIWRGGHHSAECEDIYRNMRVKRRSGCVNGVYQYIDAWERVPVGCRCQVYPRVRPLV